MSSHERRHHVGRLHSISRQFRLAAGRVVRGLLGWTGCSGDVTARPLSEPLEGRMLLATIGGTVFEDLNANGVKDTGEPGYAGATVFVDADRDGALDAGETTQISASDGSYSFTVPGVSLQSINWVAPGGWVKTSPVNATEPIRVASMTESRFWQNGAAAYAAVSGDASIVAFSTLATNTMTTDTNNYSDVFVRDMRTGSLERISQGLGGAEPTGHSYVHDISADGRYVVYISNATNILVNDTNDYFGDCFVYDRQLGTTEIVSVTTAGVQADDPPYGPRISADGRYVAFSSQSGSLGTYLEPAPGGGYYGNSAVFVFDRQTRILEMVSKNAQGEPNNKYAGALSSGQIGISGDGRYVVFPSEATNLVPGDTNNRTDVFITDRVAHTIRRISLTSTGGEATGASSAPTISDDGRYVAFLSSFTIDVSKPGGGLFVFDRQNGTYEKVVSGSSGLGSPSLSADGRIVAFTSSSALVPEDTNNSADVYVYDRATKILRRSSVSDSGKQGSGYVYPPVLNADGRYAVLASTFYSLVSGDVNGVSDTFVAPTFTGASSPFPGTWITSDQSSVAINLGGYATSGVSGFVREDEDGDGQVTSADPGIPGAVVFIDRNRSGTLDFGEPSAITSPDDPGSHQDEAGFFSFIGVTPGECVVRVMRTPGWKQAVSGSAAVFQIVRNSTDASGQGGTDTSVNTAISGDGKAIAFNSHSPNFPAERALLFTSPGGGALTPLQYGTENIWGGGVRLSWDGRYATFLGDVPGLPGDSNGWADIYVHDRLLNTFERVSASAFGSLTDGQTDQAVISGDGRFVAFTSRSSGLVADDWNGYYDVYVFDRRSRAIERVSVSATGVEGFGDCRNVSISADGRFVTFCTTASLVPEDTNTTNDVYLVDRVQKTIERLPGGGDAPLISGDGRYVVYNSSGWKKYDRITRTWVPLRLSSSDVQSNSNMSTSTMSYDGRFFAFHSYNAMIAADTNGQSDIYILDTITNAMERLSVASSGAQASQGSLYVGSMSWDARLVAFDSYSSLVPGDGNDDGNNASVGGAELDSFTAYPTITRVDEPLVLMLTPGTLAAGVDFGLRKTTLLTARLWNDRNANGQADAAETAGLDGVCVWLIRDDGDGILESTASDPIVMTRYTTDGGVVTFEGFAPGTYWIKPDISNTYLSGFVASPGTAPRLVTIGNDQHVASAAFGYYKPITVTILADENDGNVATNDISLREALGIAATTPGHDVIEFASLLTGVSSLLASLGQLMIDSPVTIRGPGTSKLMIDAGGIGRVLYLGGVTASISGLTIRGGQTNYGAGLYAGEGAVLTLDSMVFEASTATAKGGGLFAVFGTNVSISNSTFRSNSAADAGGGIYSDGIVSLVSTTVNSNVAAGTTSARGRGGGVFAAGELTANNVTLHGNAATLRGGGLYADTGTVRLTNVTLTANRADSDGDGVGDGGGFYADLATVTVNNSVLAGNWLGNPAGTSSPDDVYAVFAAGSQFNFIGSGNGLSGLADGTSGSRLGTDSTPLDARLQPLGDYGGPTWTAPPRYDSPLLDAGSNAQAEAAGLMLDQRGLTRFVDYLGLGAATVDIGAVEASRVIVVDSLLDENQDTDGKLSLREAVALAKARNGYDLIQFASSLLTNGSVQLVLSAGQLLIDSTLDVQGLADGMIILRGWGSASVLRIASGVSVTLSNVTIANGSAVNGAGIYNFGTLTLLGVLIRDNIATGNGGGVYNDTGGTLVTLNSTFSGNSAKGYGGAIYTVSGASLTLVNDTIVSNRANSDGNGSETGGAVYAATGATASVRNSVLAGNVRGTGAGTADDASGAFASDSAYNFIGSITGSTGLNGVASQYGTASSPADPMITPLGDHGGATFTHGLLPASPLTDAGSNALAEAAGLLTDARGLPRVRDGNDDALARIDIGAFEQQYPLNQAPTLSSMQTLAGAVQDKAFTLDLSYLLSRSNAADPERQPLGFRIDSLLAGTLRINGQPFSANNSHFMLGDQLAWTPPAINFGADSARTLDAFTVRAFDGQVASINTATVSITVASAAEPINYAVLFSGGDRPDLNYPLYYDNLKRLYQTLITQYGLSPANIYVLHADGRDLAADQKGGVNSDMSFAQNVLPATRDNLRSTLVQLSGKLDSNDAFFLWTFDHGLGATNRPSTTGEEILKGWGDGQNISDLDLRVWLQGLKTGENPGAYGVPAGYAGVQAAYRTYVFAQCYSGGMLDNLALDATTFGAASSNHYEASYSDYFPAAFTQALALGYNNTADAFRYAFEHDSRAKASPVPNGGSWAFNVEHPWSGGGSFPIFAMARDQNAAPELRSIAPLPCEV